MITFGKYASLAQRSAAWIMAIIALTMLSVAHADETAALRAMAKAYQTNYSAQKKLPKNAPESARNQLAARSFSHANKLWSQEIDKKMAQMGKAQSAMMKSIKQDVNAIQKGLAAAKLTKKDGVSKADALKKLAELRAKSGKSNRAGLKASPREPASGKKNGSNTETATVSRSAKSTAEVTGAEGAKDVKYGGDKELKVLDGIIQE